jgi:TrmH RNA methyltransferase
VPPPHDGAERRDFDRDEETKICGVAACQAVMSRRPDAVIKAWIEEGRAHRFGSEMAWLASERLAYKVVPREELDRVSASTHHEGLCLLVRKSPLVSPARLAQQLARRGGAATVLLLEDIGNPHNLGAIARVAAHFGVDALILCGQHRAGPSAAACRSAEGGWESLAIAEAEDPLAVLRSFAGNGFACLATSGRASAGLYQAELPPLLLIALGSEADGLSQEIAAACHGELSIPGSGAVESLNVATAAAVVLGERWRRLGQVQGAAQK